MLNHIIIMGRLTRDPEVLYVGRDEKPMAKFTLAVDRDFSRDGGERQTDFIDCVAWNSSAEFVSKYFSKGSMAVVSGRLQINNWMDTDGNNRRSASVVAEHIYFGESKKPDSGEAEKPSPRYQSQSQSTYTPGYGAFDELEDDDEDPPF